MNCLKRILCCKKKQLKGVYRLQLTNNKYYIGKSDNIEKRIWCHMNDNGSYWTRKYKVIKRLQPITDVTNSKFWELEETLENINKHGIDNVRGSMFSKITLNREDRIKASQLYCEMNDLCRKCGSKDHFLSQCKQNYVEPWVHKFGGELDLHNRKCQSCSKDINNKPNYFKYCEGCFS